MPDLVKILKGTILKNRLLNNVSFTSKIVRKRALSPWVCVGTELFGGETSVPS